MKLQHPKWWDPYSDQPYKLPPQDKSRLETDKLLEYLRTGLTATLASPLIAWNYAFPGRTQSPRLTDFVGLGISPDHGDHSQIAELVDELGVKRLLLRVPSWHLESLDDYLEFAQRFKGCLFLINILQSRDCIAQADKWQEALDRIVSQFLPLTKEFQIGNAVNRSKWGCRHTGDYLDLLEASSAIRAQYPDIILGGSSVIDFEPLATLRTLIHFRAIHLDACTSAMYVNRRGSPYSSQYGIFALKQKLRLVHAIAKSSWHCKTRLWVTETNWPLLNTKPYTPNSGLPRSTVDEQTQAEYLTDYYKIAYQLGLVERVYWWQLVNPGYGLVDHRDGMRKMPSFFAFKNLLQSDSI